MAFRLTVVFFAFIMIHLSVFFNINLLNVEGIQVLNIKINIFPYKSKYVSSILCNKDVLLNRIEHDYIYCDTNFDINGHSFSFKIDRAVEVPKIIKIFMTCKISPHYDK